MTGEPLTDEFEVLPPDWTPSGAGDVGRQSPYSIDQILPEGRRRYLKVRETFVHLTENPVRAGVLEVALFELGRALRGPGYERHPVEWREEQTRILRGPRPQDCQLWAPLSNELLVNRFYGFASEPTLKRAVSWLEKKGYLFRRRMGGSRNDRVVLVNVKQLEFDQGNLEQFADVKFNPAIAGRPEAVIAEPAEAYFASLYEGLVDVVTRASGAEGARACRAAFVLRLILAFAEMKDLAGEPILRTWSTRTLDASFPWGSRETWGKALDHLCDCGLVNRVKRSPAFLYEPNLPRILALCGESFPVEVIGSNPATHEVKSGQSSDQIEPPIGSDSATSEIKPGQEPVLKGTEIVSEIPTEIRTDLLGEKERKFERSSVSLPPLDEKAESQGYWYLKRSGSVPQHLLDFKLADLAAVNPVKAMALVELSEELLGDGQRGSVGKRECVVLGDGYRQSAVLAAMMLRHHNDFAKVPVQPLWLSFPLTDSTVGLDFEDQGFKDFVAKVNSSNDVLVIHGIHRSTRDQSLKYVRDAISHRAHVSKIILADVGDDLAGWLQSKGEVGKQILEQLTELLSEDDPAEKVRSLFS